MQRFSRPLDQPLQQSGQQVSHRQETNRGKTQWIDDVRDQQDNDQPDQNGNDDMLQFLRQRMRGAYPLEQKRTGKKC